MGRLKGIPDSLSPDILHLLAVTGHGDEIVLADMNFPTHSLCEASRAKEYRADGVKIPTLLNDILSLMPLDWYQPWQMVVMEMTDSDKSKMQLEEAPIVNEYRKIGNMKEGIGQDDARVLKIQKIERFQFYERAKKAYAIIHTGDTTPYSNIIMKRGVC
uniref:L-fucose mutarotase n=1 Tax=Hirondellea gigas TaxID=1518452 RepID=A0A2P2I6Q5_9CRUS